MPEVKPRDYTAGELTSAANVLRDAVDVLIPTSEELGRIADSLEPERADEALHFFRTGRNLAAAALHIKLGEKTVRRITKNVGRTYRSIMSWLLGLAGAAAIVSVTLGLLSIFGPDSLADDLGGFIQYFSGVCFGVTISQQIVSSRTRRQPRDP